MNKQIQPSLKSNELLDQCYCSKARCFDEIEIQCYLCARWFHKDCLEIDTGPLVRFMINYQFICKKCNVSGVESFTKKQASFHQLCTTALANLSAVERNSASPKIFFSKDKDVIPFIEKNWENMTNVPRRTKSTWHATISRSMTREDVFVVQEFQNELLYGLKDNAIEKVGPFNENMKMIGSNRISDQKASSIETSLSLTSIQNSSNSSNTTTSIYNTSATSTNTRRGSKRKTSDSSGCQLNHANSSNSRRKNANDLSRLEKMVPTCYPNEHPFNKDGYRYHLVEPDPHCPIRQKFEETELWAGKPLPGHLYRLFAENTVLLALHDRAPQLKISEDRLTVTGEKGYSMVRASHGVAFGSWYFEATIIEKPLNAATRIGWSQKLGNLQAPVGYDKFSYSWRSRKGTCFHESIGKSYLKEGYDVNDVLGFFIEIPKPDDTSKLLSKSHKDLTLVKFKNHLYYEEKDNFIEEEKKLRSVTGSKMIFYKNGKNCGVSFQNIYEGTYYPAISIYKNATVQVNFGPNFKYPPEVPYRPMDEACNENLLNNTLGDILYHIVHEESTFE